MDERFGYAACFRGLNVGSKHRVRMDDLKALFADIGASDVETYVQSGNVVFRSALPETDLVPLLATGFQARFGFDAPVLLRTGWELEEILSGCPFSKEQIALATPGADVEHLHVAFLETAPASEAVERVRAYAGEAEAIAFMGRNAWLLVRDGIHLSRIAANLHRLNVPVTLRNRNTVCRLAEMLASRSGPLPSGTDGSGSRMT